MAINPVDFGKVLRPSTVDTMNKLNEVIAVVNELSPSAIEELEAKVTTLQTNVNNLTSDLTSTKTKVATNTSSITQNTADISAIKVTLYTPLATDEATE